jgi:hypothetical protein
MAGPTTYKFRTNMKSPIPTATVKPPRQNPTGRNRGPLGFPHASAPRIKPQNTRNYHKTPPVPEASQEGGMFPDAGFGNTGMSGES